jgi:hypothetical protein
MQRGESIDFEGRKAQIVHLSQKSGRDTPHSACIELDLGEEYLTLLGYFSDFSGKYTWKRAASARSEGQHGPATIGQKRFRVGPRLRGHPRIHLLRASVNKSVS